MEFNMTLAQVRSLVIISNAIGAIIITFLVLFLKDLFDKRYQRKDDLPSKTCYEEFVNMKTYRNDNQHQDRKMDDMKEYLSNKIELMSTNISNQISNLIQVWGSHGEDKKK